MKNLPHTQDDRRAMLERAGLSEESLFTGFAPALIEAWPAEDESVILRNLSELAAPASKVLSGLGLSRPPVSSAVDSLSSRGEFVTAYTPYQPECSQGTLESIYEFQTRIYRLTGLDVSNAGLYDGSTAAVEAAVLAVAETNRAEIAVARSVAPAWREVLRAMLQGREISFREFSFDRATGRASGWREAITDRTAAVILASPNVFGVLEDEASAIFTAAKNAGAIGIHIYHPLQAALGPKPAELGAEIAVAEAQPLALHLSGGGPYLGLFSASSRLVRRIPGRIVGRTIDADGRDAFVMTLQTREQHIRREKATSNICTNQALMALRVTIQLALLGEEGLFRRAQQIRDAARKAARGRAFFSGEIFGEFAVTGGAEGIPIDYPELGDLRVIGVEP